MTDSKEAGSSARVLRAMTTPNPHGHKTHILILRGNAMNLAGFDIVCEISIDTVTDLANAELVALPDGSSAYLFGGKFDLNVEMNVLGLGTCSAALICNASLEGVAGTNSCVLSLSFSDGALTVGSRTVGRAGGYSSVAVNLDVVNAGDPSAPNAVVPAILTAFATLSVSLDATTSGSIDGTFGAGQSARFEAALQGALQSWIRALPAQTLARTSQFSVVPGQDSTDPRQLSAVPQVCWIDAYTLGIFGYYRGDASGGSLALKNDSDIVQSGPEFVYVTDELTSVVPAKRVAVLMSSAGFHLTVACPAIRTQVIRGLLFQQWENTYIAQVRANLGNAFYAQESSQHLIEYFTDEEKKAPDDLSGDYQRAKDRVQADADADIQRQADSDLNQWLDSPSGQAAIAGSVPPSCGNGSVQANRQVMPDPFGDVVSTLRELDIDLQDGYVSVSARADGNLPVCGGFTVTQAGRIALSVDGAQDRLFPSIQTDPTDVDISVDPICKVALSILMDLFAGVAWGTAITFIGAAIAEMIGENIVANLIEKRIRQAESGLTSVGVALPSNSQLLDVQIQTAGIMVRGLLGRDIDHYNVFLPELNVVVTQLERTPAGQPTSGIMSVAADPAGCKAATFAYSHQTFDTSFRVSLTAVDLAIPITVQSWQLQIGNFMYTSLGYTLNDVYLPGPFWTGSLDTVVSPVTTLEGDLWHPVPPTDGAFERRDLNVAVSGDASTGWALAFSGVDGCFYVQITVVALDANGATWSGSTFVKVTGEEVSFGQDYQDYEADCNKKKWARLLAELDSMKPYVVMGRVLPGEPIESRAKLVNDAIRRSIGSGDPGAYSLLYAAARRFGTGILNGFASGAPTVGQAEGSLLR